MEVSEDAYQELKGAASAMVEETRWECGSYIQELAQNVMELVVKLEEGRTK